MVADIQEVVMEWYHVMESFVLPVQSYSGYTV